MRPAQLLLHEPYPGKTTALSCRIFNIPISIRVFYMNNLDTGPVFSLRKAQSHLRVVGVLRIATIKYKRPGRGGLRDLQAFKLQTGEI